MRRGKKHSVDGVHPCLCPSGGNVLGVLLVVGCAGGPERNSDLTLSEWRPESGWTRASGLKRGQRVSAEKLQAESREAFEAQAYRDALQGFLALREISPPPAAGSVPGKEKAAEAGPFPPAQPSGPAAKAPDPPKEPPPRAAGAASAVENTFFLAECYYHLGESEYDKAYPYYLEVLKKNPREEILKIALSRIYDIGRAFLDGRAKRSFLGISYRSPSHGVEILLGEEGLVTLYPFLIASESALMEVAKYYFAHREYAEAEQVYERLVHDYPQSTWLETAEYELALSVYRQVRGVDYDQEALRKARSRFNLYLNHHPRGGQVEEARRFLREIAEMESQHDLKIAKYYLRESQPRAAMLYLRSVIFTNPKTDAAREAREIYENMEKRRGTP